MEKSKKTKNVSEENIGLPVYREFVKPGLHIIKGSTACGKTSMLVDFSVWALANGHKIMFSSMDVNTNSLVEKFWSNTHLTPFPHQKSDRFRLVPWSKDSIYYKACQKDYFELSTLRTVSNITNAIKTIYSRPRKDVLVIDGGDRIKDFSIDTLHELRRVAKKNKIAIVVSLMGADDKKKRKSCSFVSENITENDCDTMWGFTNQYLQQNQPQDFYKEAVNFGRLLVTPPMYTNYLLYFLKPISKFFTEKQLIEIGINSILKGAN